MTEYAFISADNHLDITWMPRNLWRDRLPASMHERAPHVVETDKGTFWEWEGRVKVVPAGEGRVPNTGSADGRDHHKHAQRTFLSRGIEVPDSALPPSDPGLLLQHFDMAGIYSGVFYGPTRKWDIQDDELLIAVYRAYNDWVLELNSAAPDRILALPLLPTRLPDAAVTECRRIIDKGVKAIEFGPFDVGRPIFDPVWEPLWATAAEADVALCSHIGDKAGTPYPPNRFGESKAHFSMGPLSLQRPLTHFVFGGVLDRHPNLRIGLGECNVGWVPYLLWAMDRQEKEREPDPDVQLSLMPSDYFYRQVSVSFEEDEIGLEAIRSGNTALLGCAVWAADYPHNHVTWPGTAVATARLFEGLDDNVRRQFVWENSARFWRIKGPQSA